MKIKIVTRFFTAILLMVVVATGFSITALAGPPSQQPPKGNGNAVLGGMVLCHGNTDFHGDTDFILFSNKKRYIKA